MRLSLLLTVIVAGALLGAAGCTAWRIGEARELARQSTPLQHTPADATLRLLIVGDSTGVGTGASAPSASLAGLLAHDHPRLWIENRARDGTSRFLGASVPEGGTDGGGGVRGARDAGEALDSVADAPERAPAARHSEPRAPPFCGGISSAR